MNPPRKSVCVYCGSRMGNRPAYAEAARAVGRMLAANGWRLVYGAGDVGLMGEVSRAAVAGGGTAMGVIPVHLLGQERRADDRATVVVTETMHERKKVMFMNADAVVVLPGGGGSLDEFFEVLTWRQLGLHSKPVILLNAGGYWDHLVALLDHIVAEGFADATLRGYVTVAEDVGGVEARLNEAFD